MNVNSWGRDSRSRVIGEYERDPVHSPVHEQISEGLTLISRGLARRSDSAQGEVELDNLEEIYQLFGFILHP